jgi:phosphoribosylamine---glycine ligase
MAKVLVVGSGGREHALLWKLAQSPRITKLYAAPGNGGTSQVAENVAIDANDFNSLVAFAKQENMDLTVVGSDNPLAHGIVDVFQDNELRIFGPTQLAARIESSKSFAKKVMKDAGIPTACHQVCNSYNQAIAYVAKHEYPLVIKADGLALGKGVYVCKTTDEANSALIKVMVSHFHGVAGDKVIIEDYLRGREVSIHSFSDGNAFITLPSAEDYKQIYDGDEGKNTGGMGVIVPAPGIGRSILQNVDRTIIQPALMELACRKTPFKGLLYPGLIITKDGLKVLEFNARFGDPEAQAYMRLMKTDLYDVLEACVDGTLDQVKIEWLNGFSVCVVLASQGYPDDYQIGFPIYGIEEAEEIDDVKVFHAGTSYVDGLRTSGGRVLSVTAIGDTLFDAFDSAYRAVSYIRFRDMYYRKDIGHRAWDMNEC